MRKPHLPGSRTTDCTLSVLRWSQLSGCSAIADRAGRREELQRLVGIRSDAGRELVGVN